MRYKGGKWLRKREPSQGKEPIATPFFEELQTLQVVLVTMDNMPFADFLENGEVSDSSQLCNFVLSRPKVPK